MGWVVIAAYRPKAGKDAELLDLCKTHHPILLAEKLVTERTPIVMRSSDGTIVECFEWVSKAATDDAHTNPAVLAMWRRYAEICEYVSLPQLVESKELFAGFVSVN